MSDDSCAIDSNEPSTFPMSFHLFNQFFLSHKQNTMTNLDNHCRLQCHQRASNQLGGHNPNAEYLVEECQGKCGEVSKAFKAEVEVSITLLRLRKSLRKGSLIGVLLMAREGFLGICGDVKGMLLWGLWIQCIV